MHSLTPKDTHLWRDISQAILEKEKNPQRFRRVFIGNIQLSLDNHAEETTAISETYQKDCKEAKNYFLGEPFPSIYFTKREAECMMLILRGYTNVQVAQQLNLSARTIEFYIKNMRQKTGCVSKVHLTSCVMETDFLNNLDFTLDDLD